MCLNIGFQPPNGTFSCTMITPKWGNRTEGLVAPGPSAHLNFCRIPDLVRTNSSLLKMAIEIVSFPSKHGDFP